VDVRAGAVLLSVLGCGVVDDQGHCTDVDTSADGLGAEQDLDLLVAQLVDALGLCAPAVLGAVVWALA